MVCDLVPGDIPVGNERVVGVVERCIVSHLRLASVRVLSLREELVDGVESVRLDGIVGGEDDELRGVFLSRMICE